MRLRLLSGILSVVMLIQLIPVFKVHAGPYVPDLPQSDHVLTGQDLIPALVLHDFNTPEDVASWKAGTNTKGVQYVTSMLNGPNSPYEGSGVLEQIPDPVKVYEWRTIYTEYEQPKDLSAYRFLAFAADSYGWQASADYVLKVKLFSGDDEFESIARIRPDQWKRVFIRLGEWEGKHAVTKMEISFMQNFDLENVQPGQPGYDSWDGRFQIDYICATNVIDLGFNQEGETEGFTAMNGSLQAQNGALAYTMEAEGGYIESPEIKIDTSKRNGMTMDMTNDTGAQELKIQWRTEGRDWSDDQVKSFTVPASGTFSQDFNFSDHPGWQGIVTAFRIIPAASAGTIKLDQIRFRQLPEMEQPYAGKAEARIDHDGKIIIEGTVDPDFVSAHPEGQLELFELATYEDAKEVLSAKTPLAKAALSESFRYETAVNDGQRSRLYSKFSVAFRAEDGTYTLMDAPQYITNPEANARNTEPYPEAQSIKGLQVQMTGDAQELGISHAALNVSYNELMYKADNHPDNTISYDLEGETFYFRKDRIERMDNAIKSLSDNGIIVSLILIMYDIKDPDSPNEFLIHPDSEPGGTVYALNTSNEMGVKYVKAATKFMAQRYSMPSEQYGRAVNYIVGNEVGQNKVWNNMGPKKVDAYVREYVQTFRLIDTIVKGEYANARTYVSLDHFWNEKLDDASLWKYDNKVIVDKMAELSRKEGDFAWNIAAHPYPEDLFNPRFWNDATATDSFDTQRITFKNLEVLVNYMKQPEFLHNGEMRRIILSEQGFHSLTNSEEHQKLQAAAYAYAYYKVKFLDGIDAFILHRHVDHGQEGGLNLGLWTHTPDSVVTPDQPKYIYDVFKYIDTARSLEVTDFAKPIIGISDWREVIPNFDPGKLQDRTLPSIRGLDYIRDVQKPGEGSGFETGTDGYIASDEVQQVRRDSGHAFNGTGYLAARFNSPYAKNWAGVQKEFAGPVDARKTPYFTTALQLADVNREKAYEAKIILYSGFEQIEGTAKLDPSKEWQQVSLPLGDWKGAKAVDRVKIWVRSEGGDPFSGELRVDEARFAEKVKYDPHSPNLEISVQQLPPKLEVGAKLTVTVTNLGSQKLNKKLRVELPQGIQASPRSIDLGDVGTGMSKKITLQITQYAPLNEKDLTLTLDYDSRRFTFPLA
ncbi:DUF5722 domain-containing protein [Paenibacillus sp. XY044]|uniref:DUF5722 domain-containing protein n=1 Tax=Paenibacillus sp. XY044 TaxID=2026089 RepID=UPI000B98A302|nr:DUF5722 domain-containing protein [Paenibacillus sp. XY044]OZB91308.1 hypothetical protein CJP46_28905 [Paenibacillus sp. XY044]